MNIDSSCYSSCTDTSLGIIIQNASGSLVLDVVKFMPMFVDVLSAETLSMLVNPHEA